MDQCAWFFFRIKAIENLINCSKTAFKNIWNEKNEEKKEVNGQKIRSTLLDKSRGFPKSVKMSKKWVANFPNVIHTRKPV